MLTKHCRDCNKDYLECEQCRACFRTNVRTCPEVQGHDCRQGEDGETAEAVAAGAAGGLAAGTAGGLAVTAGAPAALGAAGFTSTGIARQSLAASCQSLYKGATPAGGWFATCQSAGAGGSRGCSAVTAVAVLGGAAIAAAAGYGIYRLVKGNRNGSECPWCLGRETVKIKIERT